MKLCACSQKSLEVPSLNVHKRRHVKDFGQLNTADIFLFFYRISMQTDPTACPLVLNFSKDPANRSQQEWDRVIAEATKPVCYLQWICAGRFRELLYVAGKMSDIYRTQATHVALPVVHLPVAVVILRLPYLATVCWLEFRSEVSSLDLFCVIYH